MALVPGIQRRVSTAAALSLLVAGAILIVALAAAANTRAAGQGAVDAAGPLRRGGGRAAEGLHQPADVTGELRDQRTASRAGRVPAGRGDFARARALQADSAVTRPYTLAVRTRMAALQAQITSMQAHVTTQLTAGQRRLLADLVAVCVMVAVIVADAVMVVRGWLLRPVSTLRQAAGAVAAGRYDTPVPAVGPAELADLGRAAELMRAAPPGVPRTLGMPARTGRSFVRFGRYSDQ